MRERGRLLEKQEWISLKSNFVDFCGVERLLMFFLLRVCLFYECEKVIRYIVKSFLCGCKISLVFVVHVRMAVLNLIKSFMIVRCFVCVCV